MSFSAEMKAFINAYSTGQKINASRTDQDYKEQMTEARKKTTERENDPETLATAAAQAKANLALTQKRMSNIGAGRGARDALLGVRTEVERERLRQLRAAGQPTGSGLLPPQGAIPLAAPGAAPQGALPLGPATLTEDDADAYADGGLVPDEDEDDDDAEDEAVLGATEGALPISNTPAAAPVAAPVGGPTDVSAPRREPTVPKGLEGVISPALVHDATKAGMTFLARESGLSNQGAIASPRTMAMARQIAAGAGGLSEEEMQAAKKTVDPEGKLTESQRNMAALGSVYQFWANKGEPQKAEKVAAQMLQYYRNAAQRYAAIAAKAAEGGNVDLATKAALKAYQNVPDGNDLELLPNPDGGIMYAVTGPNGDVITKGIATPQQLAASAMGLATGGFDKAILAAAGAREAAPAVGGKGGGKPQSATDRAKEEETAMGAVEKMKAKWVAANEGKPVDEEFWEQAGNVATHIMQQNKVTSSEAARAAELLISPGKKDPEKPDFKVTPGEEGKPNKIRFGNGLTMELDDNQLDQVMNARAARVKSAVDKINTDMEESEKPNKIVEGAKVAGGAIARDVEKFGNEVKGAVGDEFIARAGSAVKAGSRAAQDVLNKVLDPSINFGTLSTAYKKKVIDAAETIGEAIKSKGAIPVDDGDRPL